MHARHVDGGLDLPVHRDAKQRFGPRRRDLPFEGGRLDHRTGGKRLDRNVRRRVRAGRRCRQRRRVGHDVAAIDRAADLRRDLADAKAGRVEHHDSYAARHQVARTVHQAREALLAGTLDDDFGERRVRLRRRGLLVSPCGEDRDGAHRRSQGGNHSRKHPAADHRGEMHQLLPSAAAPGARLRTDLTWTPTFPRGLARAMAICADRRVALHCRCTTFRVGQYTTVVVM